MQAIKFYDDLPDMEFTAGDTLPVFAVGVTNASLTNAQMFLILSKKSNPVEAVIEKECTLDNGTYKVRLTSEDTSGLTEGEYILLFSLNYSAGNCYRKLRGNVYIHGAT